MPAISLRHNFVISWRAGFGCCEIRDLGAGCRDNAPDAVASGQCVAPPFEMSRDCGVFERSRTMSTAFSVAEILARLEERISHHEKQIAFHQQQEAHHRGQVAAHAAELETIRRHFDSFKATALPAADLVGALVAVAPKKEEEEDYRDFVGKRIMTSKLIARTVDRLGGDEVFGATRVAQETNRRHRERLKTPVDARAVSVVLRRLRDAGEIHQVKPGGAAHQALFSKRRPG
jgi:hypothetical protein